jgi:hypothetical protein
MNLCLTTVGGQSLAPGKAGRRHISPASFDVDAP